MPRFVSFIENEKFRIGCTGQTVYLYDNAGNELAKFRDLSYAYTPLISPNGNIFVVKTTDGRLAVYSLCGEPRLIKKFRFSKVDGSQDDNFCFSPDGKYLYDIERHGESYISALSIYDTDTFELIKRLFENDPSVVLTAVEADEATAAVYLLGYLRNNESDESITRRCFIGILNNDEITQTVDISEDEGDFLWGYKSLEMNGFTESAKSWSSLRYDYDLAQISKEKHSLAGAWAAHRNG